MDRHDTELALHYLVSGGVVAYQRALAHAVGDALAGLLASQLWYWSGRQPEEREGWFFMTQEQIFAETALSRREQETSRRKLRALGILEEERRGRPARLWYRINVKRVVQLIENAAHIKNGGIRQSSMAESANLGDCTNPPIQSGGKRQTISKNTSKTSSKTSATAGARPERGAGATNAAAAEALIEELVAQGVGRATAEHLAREKPDLCRRYLDYLPYAEVRTTRGAWLTSAIRDEYGPPQGYVEARRREGQKLAAGRAALAVESRISQNQARQQAIALRLRRDYARMEKEQGAAFLAFMAHLAAERQKAERVAEQLSAPRRAEYLASFESGERRLELFARWREREADWFAAGNETPGSQEQRQDSMQGAPPPPKAACALDFSPDNRTLLPR
ncbi:MAG: hypothetical protein ACJ8F7_22000 [Gemmataceae bacterium]